MRLPFGMLLNAKKASERQVRGPVYTVFEIQLLKILRAVKSKQEDYSPLLLLPVYPAVTSFTHFRVFPSLTCMFCTSIRKWLRCGWNGLRSFFGFYTSVVASHIIMPQVSF